MNIVAVIPARAGSKGIPNKNIRMIGGHPLVYYSLSNALKSKYINRVIVTTDSLEIKAIANLLHADVVWRKAELCKDDVTLDSVVFDAIKNIEDTDIVITMQPTSPNLKVETLDNAIKDFISNNYDTLISVVNKPHLSWGRIDGKIVPNYEKRLNRQFLPPNYLETGAFVISKRNVINEFTRIGKKVGVFEVPEDESIDIDNFNDWVSASFYMKKEKVGIYVNGNNKLGAGHVYRALELADEMNCKPDIIFDANQTNKSIFGNTTHNLVSVNGESGLFELCNSKQYTLFINDILSTSSAYMSKLKGVLKNAKIVNFEDDGPGQNKANLVFNALLGKNDLPHSYCGEKYYICGKLFLFYKPIHINRGVKKVFITFGGADPQNYSDRLLKIISKDKYKKISFVVVLGRAKKNIDELLRYNSFSNIEVFYDVKNMPELMSKCDIAVTSRGRTGYELAILGIPSLAMAQNSREEKHEFVCDYNGFIYIGRNPNDSLIENKLDSLISSSSSERKNMQKRMLSHDLKSGRERVMRLIRSL